MLAALTAAEDGDCRVVLFEKQSRVGKKLLATGNGRCNLTNTGALSERDCGSTGEKRNGAGGPGLAAPGSALLHYHGNAPDFALPALRAFPPEKVLSRFRSLGLICTEQYGGRVYPLSDTAGSVLDVLRFALDSAGVELHTGEPVAGIEQKGGRFLLRTERQEETGDHAGTEASSGIRKGHARTYTYIVDRVIVACGGPAGGKNGGCGDGYALLKALGHHCTKLYPALVPIRTDTDYPRSLKGVRADAALRLFTGSGPDPAGAPAAVGTGELQFVEKGISGPAAFDISREASVHGGTVCMDFLRTLSEEEVLALLRARRSRSPELELSALFTGLLHSRLGTVIVKAAGFRPSALIGSLTDAELTALARTAKHFVLRVTGTDSFDAAQITVGGMDTDEFDPGTMESRLVPGLYACGEVLDIDADCGGFNLQWAWASGCLAGHLGRAGAKTSGGNEET